MSEQALTVKILKVPKHCWNLQQSTFIIFFSSLWDRLNCKISLLVIYEILGLFVNALTADDKYSFRKKEKLLQPIQI